MDFYPLKLSYHTRNYYFGEELIRDLKDDLPEGRIAETWEISDYQDTTASILNGNLAGKKLRELIQTYPEEIVAKSWSGPHFPILAKFLDASHFLPVHLHADDKTAKEKYGEPNGKTEAWYILWAAEDASILVGIKDGFSKQELFAAFKDQNYDRVMYRYPIKTGDTVYVPSGILHSFGPNTLIYEVQQTSDLGSDVMPTDLFRNKRSEEEWDRQINKTLAELKTHFLPKPNPGLVITEDSGEKKVCCASEYFVLEHWLLNKDKKISNFNKFMNITNLAKPVEIEYPNGTEVLKKGESCIVPAAVSEFSIKTDQASLLISYLPDLEADIIKPLQKAGYSLAEIASLGEI